MIPYIPCETARERLEQFVDRELSTTDQVAVQAHLRSCRTCEAHVEDLSLIGWSVRAGAPAINPAADAAALTVIQSGVLTRIRAERAESLRMRVGEMFTDMRLLWPALGATTAVVLCATIAINVWRATMAEISPDSLVAMLHTLGHPGSDRNPLRLDLEQGMSVPRLADEGFALGHISTDDTEYVLSAIVKGDGTVDHAELLDSTRPIPLSQVGSADAILLAFKESRFSPAQARSGQKVAVMAIFYFMQTTAVKEATKLESVVPARHTAPPSAAPGAPPVPLPRGARSSIQGSSTTA